MYPSQWGLAEPPFRNRLDARFFHPAPAHEEALARLQFLVDQRRRLGLLLGSRGSGKSLVLEVFAQTIRRSGWPLARVVMSGLHPCEFLWQVATQLGLWPDAGLRPGVLWPMVTDRLSEYRYQQVPTVLLLDDVDMSDDAVFSLLGRLSQFDQTPDSRLTIVLAAHPDGVAKLGESLLERVELRIDLAPWGPDETAHYLNSAVTKAGGHANLFDQPAIERLHELSCGVPRRVSQLADLALLAGAGRNLDTIDAATIDSVCRELGAVEV